MTRSPRYSLPALLLPILLSSVAMAEPSAAERAWRADKPTESRSETSEGHERRFRGGPQGGDGARRLGWVVAKIQGDFSRLEQAESEILEAVADLKRDRERTAEQPSVADQSRFERRERIIELRRELLELERAEVVERVRREAARAHQWAKEQRAAGLPPGAPPPTQEFLQRLAEHSERLAQAADYAQVRAIIEEMHAERAALNGQIHNPVLDRMRREVEMLRKRIEHLHGEMAELENSPDNTRMAGRRPGPSPPGSRPPAPPPPNRRPR